MKLLRGMLTIAQELQAELDEVLQRYAEQKTETSRQHAVRNSCQPKGNVLTGDGKVSVKLLKVRSHKGEAVNFQSSALVPPPQHT